MKRIEKWRRIEKWNRKITCSAKIILIVIAVIVYFNIGYLVAYSTSSTTTKTPTTQIVYKIIDFYGVLDLVKQNDGNSFFVIAIALWPIMVAISWVVNFIAMGIVFTGFIFSNIWSAIHWTFTGEIWKLIGFIK